MLSSAPRSPLGCGLNEPKRFAAEGCRVCRNTGACRASGAPHRQSGEGPTGQSGQKENLSRQAADFDRHFHGQPAGPSNETKAISAIGYLNVLATKARVENLHLLK